MNTHKIMHFIYFYQGWSTQQMNIFLEYLLTYANDENPFCESVLLALDVAYNLTKSNNAEIKFRWQSLCLCSDVPWIGTFVLTFYDLPAFLLCVTFLPSNTM